MEAGNPNKSWFLPKGPENYMVEREIMLKMS